MRVELMKLPYGMDALAPLISGETLEYHYNHHHRAYVDNVIRAIVGTRYARCTLEEILGETEGSLFNNAAQAWNHAFYWSSLCPPGKSVEGVLAFDRSSSSSFLGQVRRDFGNIDGLKRSIIECGLSVFGSGWVWLVRNEAGRLRVVSTQDADNPLRVGLVPLLACDVWEHAYYLDHKNERGKYLEAVMKLINLKHAAQRFEFLEPKRDSAGFWLGSN